jgi:hypothetical protein
MGKAKKESWWKRWMPKCGAGKPKDRGEIPSHLEDTVDAKNNASFGITIKCLSCGQSGEFQSSAFSYVCKNCHRVHRVYAENFGTSERRLSITSEGEPITLVRTSSTTFLPVTYDENAQARPSEPVVPQCQVCMDGPGDIVLLPCSHGAICEACAKHIARNLSVGGNHCVKCRQEIQSLVRLSELYTDHATGISVVVPQDSVRKGPPKVPPPPGLNKSKNASRQ